MFKIAKMASITILKKKNVEIVIIIVMDVLELVNNNASNVLIICKFKKIINVVVMIINFKVISILYRSCKYKMY